MSLRDKLGYGHLPEQREAKPKFPVTDFSGTLDVLSEKKNEFDDTQEDLVLGFTNLQNVVADPAYTAHTLEISIKESVWPTSAYMLFFTTVIKAAGISIAEAREANLSIEDFVGRHLHLQSVVHDYGVDKKTGKQVLGNYWHCLGISDAPVKLSPLAIAVSLLEGKKTASQWATAVTNHADLKGNQVVSAKVVSWADEGIEKALDGIVTRDSDGIYHVDSEKLSTMGA